MGNAAPRLDRGRASPLGRQDEAARGATGTMTGEALMARSALVWSVVVAVPASVAAGMIAGTEAALSIALATTVVFVNVLMSVGFAVLGNKLGGWAPIAMTLPSFAVRMIVSLLILSVLKGQAFINKPVFVAAFGVALTFVLVLQSLAWKRTPWLVHAFSPSSKETV